MRVASDAIACELTHFHKGFSGTTRIEPAGHPLLAAGERTVVEDEFIKKNEYEALD